jgi:hypothetical protein
MIDEVHEHILLAFVWLVDMEHTINTNVSGSSKANYDSMYYEYNLVTINSKMLNCLYYRVITVVSPVLKWRDVSYMFENMNVHFYSVLRSLRAFKTNICLHKFAYAWTSTNILSYRLYQQVVWQVVPIVSKETISATID